MGDAFRLLAVAGLVAAQVVAAGRCAACDPGECAACVAGADAKAATADAACPLCAGTDAGTAAGTAAGGCHATDHDAAPCACQWEPRDDEPVVPPSRPVVDLATAAPWPAPAPADQRTATLVARLPDFSDIPQRPVRILLGVWRN